MEEAGIPDHFVSSRFMAILLTEGVHEACCQEWFEIVTYTIFSYALRVLCHLSPRVCESFELETAFCPCLNRNKSDLSFFKFFFKCLWGIGREGVSMGKWPEDSGDHCAIQTLWWVAKGLQKQCELRHCLRQFQGVQFPLHFTCFPV